MSHHYLAKFDVLAPRSKLYQGPFGRLCPDLPAWEPPGVPAEKLDDFFLGIAKTLMIEEPGATPSDIAGDPQAIQRLERKFGSNTPAGYTYFGQFIDHDITFDPASSLQRQNDPSGLLNFRTPRLDLDNVYGRGPDEQPYLYDQEDRNPGTGKVEKMLIGAVRGSRFPDLPRNTPTGDPAKARALIGDMRNDENAMVSQLQLAFLLAHNTLVERARKLKMDNPFEAARKTLRWLYQWIVWHDFLPRVTLEDVHGCALRLEKACGGRRVWKCGLDDVYRWKHQPFMPVEFSVAAYRFGHSMVRNGYQTNHPHRGAGSFAPIFDNCSTPPAPDDLRGFRPMELPNVIQWDWFLKMTTSGGPFPQNARKIDTKLANALACLHEGPQGDALNVLAFRNLKRGHTFGLPSGPDVATKFCIDKPVKLDRDEPHSLWYYILKEAEQLPGAQAGQSLGQVGSIIVCAVFAGLLKGDPCSFLNIDSCWTPNNDPLLRKGKDNIDSKPDWALSTIIRLSGLPVDAGDVDQVTNNGVTLPV